ncbi:SUMO-activating enzyme subunit 1 [Nowakowskiella sp. JEL0407]|nr:SUMO-activating enzyme subunit 1 [Nowakowskiella sp. JEL0407]
MYQLSFSFRLKILDRMQRAEAAIVNAQKLNPLVKISAVTSNIIDTPDSFFESFHLIILSDATLSLMLRLDKLCGEKNIKFWATRVSGFNGFFFCDLISHEYTEQSQSPSGAVTKTEKHVDYVSLEHALSSKLSVKEGISIKKLKKLVSPLFFGFVGLLKFEMEAGVWPKEDEEGLKKVVYEVCEGYGVPKELVDDKLISALAKQAATEFTPVAAILGGIVAQEVLRTLSAKDAPSNNFFTIDVFSSEGSVMAVGVEPEAKKEDKGKQKEVMSMDTEEQDGVLILD